MIKIQNILVSNFENAMRGLRNPLNSWGKSDSEFSISQVDFICDDSKLFDILDSYNKIDQLKDFEWIFQNGCSEYFKHNDSYSEFNLIGPKDLALAQTMIIGGADEAKFMRQIFVSMDITAPLYW